jgi:hypothetical protein
MLFTAGIAVAQQSWPQSITMANGDLIKIYQPQPESLSADKLVSRAAVSLTENGKTNPVFGMFWSEASLNAVNGGSGLRIQGMRVTNIKFPATPDNTKTDAIKSAIEQAIPGRNIVLSKDELQTALSQAGEQEKLSSQFNNTPPKVIYADQASVLVLIDGAPKWQMNNDWGVEAVINTPYTIVKNSDGLFYLYGGKNWYSADAATGPYRYSENLPDNLRKIETAINHSGQKNNNDETSLANKHVIPQIIISTEPAELIQSNGEANFSPIEGTGLLYVKNSSNDIFMDMSAQQYYVLLSGRWYKASTLKSQWQYIAADKLPPDFAKIPAGSPKDNVLASVAGTNAAQNAVMDAAVPQTAKVDRNTASAEVTYDGNPEFDRIDGTRLQYAVNASGTVLKLYNRYYLVDKGVWFESYSPAGPWTVAVTRPDEVDLIPPSYPVYNVKYVYIYDITPDFVYMGYTPGYLNTYIYGPTVVYGTGYYYRPWYRHYYYARPYTWGFNMNYNPWYGWSFGTDFNYGWFNIGFGRPYWNYWTGGWWGPAVYRPAYCGAPYRSYGYYGSRYYYPYRNSININVNYTNNIYRYRRDVVTTDNRRWAVNNDNYNRRGTVNNNYSPGNHYPDRNRFPGNNTDRVNGSVNRGADGPRYNNRNNDPGFQQPQCGINNGNSDPGRRNNDYAQPPVVNRQGNQDQYNRWREARSRQNDNTPQRRYSPASSAENRGYNRAPEQRVERPGSNDNSRSGGDRRGDGRSSGERGGFGRRG